MTRPSLRKAAYQVGYASPSQFSREFKRQFGMAPHERIVDEWMGFSREHEVSDAYYVLTDQESQEWMKKVPFDTDVSSEENGKDNEIQTQDQDEEE